MPLPEQSSIQPIKWSDSTPGDNRKTVTVAGTRERLVAASLPVKWVVIQSLRANTDFVVTGASTVVAADGSERGVSLPPAAMGTVTLYGLDLTNVWVDSVVSGEGVQFFYGT